jgi:phosphoglycolate phosphatase
MEAMYASMDDMLAEADALDLRARLTPPEKSKTEDDRRLVAYVNEHRRLHPKLKSEKKVSRTDLLEVLFGPDEDAKRLAHQAFNRHYRNHYGDVVPFEPGIREVIEALKAMGVKVGILTNRVHEFLAHELEEIEAGGWDDLFEIVVAGDDTARLKPWPDPVLKALQMADLQPAADIWYVGDSTTDTMAAKAAGITNVFYNGAKWEPDWIMKIFPDTPDHPHRPDRVVNNFNELLVLVSKCWNQQDERKIEKLVTPTVILFDWHATLVDTLDAMYHAVDDMLMQLQALGLVERLTDPKQSKNVDDQKLVEYVKDNYALHPKIKAARKISRTDIFEILFGEDFEAKQTAHEAFNICYRLHYGAVEPLEEEIPRMLRRLRVLGIKTGVLSNRDREFLEHELGAVDGVGWIDLFDTIVAGDDPRRRKPEPDPIFKALDNLNVAAGPGCWYVGDSTTDTIAAKNARATSVFYNGAKWDKAWLAKIFPGTTRHPHKPDIVVNDFREFLHIVERLKGSTGPVVESATKQ